MLFMFTAGKINTFIDIFCLTCLCNTWPCLCMHTVKSQKLSMVRRHLSNFSFGGVSLPDLKICGNQGSREEFEGIVVNALYEGVLVETWHVFC